MLRSSSKSTAKSSSGFRQCCRPSITLLAMRLWRLVARTSSLSCRISASRMLTLRQRLSEATLQLRMYFIRSVNAEIHFMFSCCLCSRLWNSQSTWIRTAAKLVIPPPLYFKTLYHAKSRAQDGLMRHMHLSLESVLEGRMFFHTQIGTRYGVPSYEFCWCLRACMHARVPV